VTEHPELWLDRVPARWREEAPHVERDPETGWESWTIGDVKEAASVGGTAVGAGDYVFPDRPKTFEECPPAAWDAAARLGYMDSVGVWAELVYPNVGGFGNAAFLALKDDDLRLACVRAYNDWLADWCSADDRRLLGVCALPFWDVAASVAEVHRCAELGHRAILFTGEPQRFTEKFFGDPHWDPLWRAASETSLPISFHLGSGDMDAHFFGLRNATYGVRATIAQMTVGSFLGNGAQVADFLLSGVLPRFPDLTVASVESGAGWAPFVLQACDYVFDDFSMGIDYSGYEMRPSEYFRHSMAVCYFAEPMPPYQVEAIGEANLLFETDFPHGLGLDAATVRQTMERVHVGNSPDVRRRLTFGNAQRLYRIEPPPAMSRIGS
jgi:predicted TIM-barrel fold metal-dependent hydrolase